MHSVLTELQHQFQLPLHNPVIIFSLILFIILIVPPLFDRLRLPGVIGLILAGAVIGPDGFNVLGKNLFVDVFSTVGLMYIMFLAGLELDLHEFRANRNKSLWFGVCTFAIPLAIGAPVCYYLLGFDPSASLLTASIFATHTLVTYPVVSRFGISKDSSVALTVGGTILTDTAVLVMLAVILGAHRGDLTASFWLGLGVSLVLFSGFMAFVVPRFANWFFRVFESERHLHYIFLLAVTFLAAFLAEVAGLEAIIGAFAAGLALNKTVPRSSALMNRVEFIGNALFIPFFLISVGMIINVQVIFSGTAVLLIAFALTAVAIFGKYMAAWATQHLFRLSRNQRHLIFGLSSAHAAATLAVVLVGYREGIVGDNILNAVVVIILVSCIVASLVTRRVALAMAGSNVVEADPQLVSELDMEQIVVPISRTANVERLLNFAVLIKEKKSRHPLVIVNVVPNTGEAEQRVAAAKKTMESFTSEATGADVDVNVVATIDYDKPSGISRTAREVAGDIVVMGWPRQPGPVALWVDERVAAIVRYTVKVLFLCHLPSRITGYRALHIVVPPLAEREIGFATWVEKMTMLANELSLPVRLYGTQTSREVIEGLMADSKVASQLRFRTFEDWEDFLVLFREVSDQDLFAVVLARHGARSYNRHMERIPDRIARHFPELNRILIYPQ